MNQSLSAHQQRHLSALAKLLTDITHHPGSDNVMADALSRASLSASVSLGLNPNDIASVQSSCPKLTALHSSHNDSALSLSLQEVRPFPDSHLLWCETSCSHSRPFLPNSLRHTAFYRLHQLAHPGVRGSQSLVGERFFWPRMRNDITCWTKECLACQASKVHQHVRSPVQHIPIPADTFTHVHVDIVGPLPPSCGYSYPLTVVDRTSQWPEALPMTGISAD